MVIARITIDLMTANSDSIWRLSRKAALCVQAPKQSPAEDRGCARRNVASGLLRAGSMPAAGFWRRTASVKAIKAF